MYVYGDALPSPPSTYLSLSAVTLGIISVITNSIIATFTTLIIITAAVIVISIFIIISILTKTTTSDVIEQLLKLLTPGLYATLISIGFILIVSTLYVLLFTLKLNLSLLFFSVILITP